LIELYAKELKDKCGETVDIDLLTKVTIGCGPAIYREDSTLVAGSDVEERATIRQNFLVRKLGLPDGPELDAAIDSVMERYGRSNRSKHRAVVYYLLTKHFGRQAVYA
jgi:hypothetical protein